MKSHLKCTKLLKSVLRAIRTAPQRNLTGIQSWNEELTDQLKHKIEKHWTPKLLNPVYDASDETREKYYVLSMFPYPSGHLHMGHVRVYTISDSVARFQRMNNKTVIHPIGWDAFGLPAENAAIERNIPPDEWTQQNIQQMKQQLKQLGCSFEWHRELATCDPQYYKWTQDLFLKLHEAGLVYQKEAWVNWDPIDKTVLADEQVDENGHSWRSGAKVERKLLRQWFVRTTRFARQLFEGLDDPILQDWRDVTKIQKHWIGVCDGIALDFPLSDRSNFLTLWSRTPEYLAHAKFVAISPKNVLAGYPGKDLGGSRQLEVAAINPVNKELLPIFVTNEVEYAEGTDSHVGIPGVSEIDAEFCDKLQIGYAPVQLLSDEQDVRNAHEDICKNFGGYWTSSKLRDWLISRQRYWGTPIPVIHCSNCGTLPVPREALPVELPKKSEAEWSKTTCWKCNGPADKETDTMDTFVDSSWYYLRYLDPAEPKEMFSVEKAKKMTPVDLYIGGKEHAALHLYYARFISYFLHSLGLLPEREPFKRLLVQGMVMGRSYRIKNSGQYVPEAEVKILDAKRNKAVHLETDKPVVMSWEKMSKSKRNGVDPQEMFDKYSVDTTRLLILADVAPTSHRNWNSNTFPGILNWQKRLWLTVQDFLNHRRNLLERIPEEKLKEHEDYMYDSRNYYVKGATFNYCASQQISVAISKMQGLTNSIRRMPAAAFAYSPQFQRALSCQLILLAPIAPHFASELWAGFVSAPNRLDSNEISWDKAVLEQRWPVIDSDYKLDLICEVNNAEVGIVKVAKSEIEHYSKEEALNAALTDAKVQEAIGDTKILAYSFVMRLGYEGVIRIKSERAALLKKAAKNK